MMRHRYNMLQLLLLLLCWQHASIAVQLPNYSTDLHIELNPVNNPSSDTQNMIAYTSVVEYDFDTKEFDDSQFAGIAQQAWEEMKAAHIVFMNNCPKSNKWLKSSEPYMMSAIAVGNQIYFSSSMKKNSPNALLKYIGSDGKDQGTVITRALAQCRVDQFDAHNAIPSEDLHQNKGNCGEIVASALHYARNENFPWDAPGGNVRVVAFGGKNGQIRNPCQWSDKKDPGENTQKTIGCRNWVDWKNMIALQEDAGIVPKKVSRAPSNHFQVDLNDIFELRTPRQLDP